MKKLLLLVSIIAISLVLTGCVVDENTAGELEQYKNKCRAIESCSDWMDDATEEQLTRSAIIDEIQESILKLEDRVESLEEMTEGAYLDYISYKYFESGIEANLGGAWVQEFYREEIEEGIFEVTFLLIYEGETFTSLSDIPSILLTDQELLIQLNSLHNELPNYLVNSVNYMTYADWEAANPEEPGEELEEDNPEANPE